MRKRFDEKLFKDNDYQARKVIKKLFSKYDIRDNTDKYGVDLIIFLKNKPILNVECEIKRVWKTKNFPFNSVQFPERKKKFAHLKLPTIFCMLNASLNTILIVHGEDLLKSPLKEVANKYLDSGEKFFSVPLDKVVFLGVG